MAGISRLLDEVMALALNEREAWLARLAMRHAAHHEALRGLLDTLGRIEDDDFLNDLPRLEIPRAV